MILALNSNAARNDHIEWRWLVALEGSHTESHQN